MSKDENTVAAYNELVERLREIHNITQTKQLLDWDRLVTMPADGTPVRNRQQSTIDSVMKEKLTNDRVGDLLDRIATEKLGEKENAVVREARNRYEKNKNSPEHLENSLRQKLNESQKAWQRTAKTTDFGNYVPLLDDVLQLQRERASHLDSDRDPATVLFENKHSGIDVETADRLFDHLLDELVPLREELVASTVEKDPVFEGATTYPEAKQDDLNRALLDELGYDWDRGRFDAAPHAFSCGNPYDVRIATTYDESNPTEALLTTLHEFGHAAYTFGLPGKHYGTPLGRAMKGFVHESQSIFWENHVGRSHEFWELVVPKLTDAFPGLDGVTADQAYEAVNRIHDGGLGDVKGREITLHITNVIRHRMERNCHEMDDLEEIPAVLADEMESHLGVRPDTDARFRSAPWPKGFFGFETYTFGAILAAQLYTTASTEIEAFDAKIRRGEFEDLRHWLTENVYSHGQRYTASELVERATGEELTAKYYTDYVKEKYNRIYDI